MMKKVSFFLTLILFTLVLSAQSTLQSTSFTSPALSGANFPVDIYLPDGYTSMQADYPLYIFLHGCCGNAPAAYTSLFKSRLDALIGTGQILPMVVAFPSIQGADFGNRHIFSNSARNGQYGDAITQDLMGFLNANYRIKQDVGLRAIGGFSMGGDGAWRLGLAHPDSFGAILSHGAFPALEPFPSIILSSFLQENGGVAPYSFSPSAGAISAIVYGISSVWSPNTLNMPHQVDLPVKTDGNMDTVVFRRWFPIADVNTIIRQTWTSPQALPQAFYFDVGRQISLLLPSNELLQRQVDTLIQDGYDFPVKSIIFEEPHQLSQARMDSSLLWLSEQFDKGSVHLDENMFSTPPIVRLNHETSVIEISWEEMAATPINARLINIEGKIFAEKISMPGDEKISLPMHQLIHGFYILQVETPNHTWSQKVIW